MREDYSSVPEYTMVSEGEHRARVVESFIFKSAKGNDTWQMVIEIIDGADKGQTVKCYAGMGENSKGVRAGLLRGLEFTKDELSDIDFDKESLHRKIVGMRTIAVIIHEDFKGKDGFTRKSAKVKRLKPMIKSDNTPDPLPPAQEDDTDLPF